MTNIGHLFLARALHSVPPSDNPTHKDDWTELVWIDYHEAITLILDGTIMESTSLAALGKAEAARHRDVWTIG